METRKYGNVPTSQKEIVSYYTEPDVGTIVGYSLYNRLRLTTQVGKVIEIYSSRKHEQAESGSGVHVTHYNMVYTPEVKAVIHMMDVLLHRNEIQEFNYPGFLEFSKEFAQQYSDEVFNQVNQCLHYPEKTIAYLREVLKYYGIENHLIDYLGTKSEDMREEYVFSNARKNPYTKRLE